MESTIGTDDVYMKIRLMAGIGLLAVIVLLISLTYSHLSRYLPWQAGEEGNQTSNVILIIVDTLRPDALSCYNPETVKTPNIDQLAGDGILFTNVISVAPWTLPSVASIMTGLHPSAHLALRPESKLSGTTVTLAEHLQNAGYVTAAIGSNIFLVPDYNISQGFDEYQFYPRSSTWNTIDSTMSQYVSTGQNWLDISTDDITEKAIGWLEKNVENNFFLWIHYFDPHIPYSPPADFLPEESPPLDLGQSFEQIDKIRSGEYVPTLDEKEWIRTLYLGEVRHIDENIGKIIDTLKRWDLYDESLIVFMSDHGEEFWEHDGFEHGHTLYNELLRIPLIIKLPDNTPSGRRNELVSTQSIMPTILDLCEIDYESDHIQANSLAPCIIDSTYIYEERQIISTGLLYGEEQESIIFRGMKYIRALQSDRGELFDMTDDPEERNPILSPSRELISRAEDLLKEHGRKAEEVRERLQITEPEKVEIDAEIREWLQSLGYLR